MKLLAGGEGEPWRERVAAIEGALRRGLEPARELPGVADVRVLGAIGVIELGRDVDVSAATAAAVARGVWLRPFRNLIYSMPPYVIAAQDLAAVAGAMVAARASRRRLAIGALAVRDPAPPRQPAPARASCSRPGSATRSSVATSTAPRRAIVSRFERSIGAGPLRRALARPRRQHDGPYLEAGRAGGLEGRAACG